jgi:ABC-type glycerol-3-phosphate transport system substrate-binding protein
MNTKMLKISAILLAVCFVLSGCGGKALFGPTATPTPSLGTIKGTVSVSSGQSLQDITLDLWSATGTGDWKRMDDAHITAKPDGSGAFVFESVPAGTYVIAFMSGSSSSKTPNYFQNASGSIASVDVAAGQNVELGTLHVTGQ